MPAEAAPPKRLFVYGTLRDPDIFRIVAGAPQAVYRPAPALLQGRRAVRLEQITFPSLGSGGRAPGLLLHGLTRQTWRRLVFYEHGDYSVRTLNVWNLSRRALVPAAVFCGDGSLPATSKPWSLSLWRVRQKRLALAAARLFMDYLDAPAGTDLNAAWHDVVQSLART